MDKTLNFLTKELVDNAVLQIDKNGIPSKREGTGYAVIINNKKYPFKLLVTEAAKIAKVNVTSNHFSSNANNRLGFEKITGYTIIDLNEKVNFKNLKDLADIINDDLAEFCSKFQYKRKELLKMGSATNRDKLFIYPDTSRDWAINPGGGTELQYHIYLRNNKIGYGLGFNTQYVPFANKKTPVDYIKPFVNSFLSKPEFQQNLVQNGFYYVLGSEDLLKNLENDKYVLIGKELTVLKNNELFELDYLLFEEMISEIKGVLYKTYKNVLLNMNEENKLSESIIEKIKILKHKKQIILQGPPGTGKTYTAKDIAEQFIFNAISSDKKEQKKNLEATDQFSLVQFHPSYSYEDFVRGITAKSEGGNIVYETENKILASFAEKAMSNLSSVNKDVKELSKEQQIEQLLIQLLPIYSGAKSTILFPYIALF